MGGIGSGSWVRRNTKLATDQLYALDVNMLVRDGLLRSGVSGVLRWSFSGSGVRSASVSFSVGSTNVQGRVIQIEYRWNHRETICETIALETTSPHFSGTRWWFTCPMSFHDGTCDRRVAKLYLRDGRFGCRHCHDLTYRSCQESHRLSRLFDRLSRMVGAEYDGELEESRSTFAK